MNKQVKELPASPAEVTRVYNEKQDAIGLAMLRLWVPAALLDAIRRDLEKEKVDYLIELAEEAGSTDKRVIALSQRNIAAPMGATDIAALRKFMEVSTNKDAVMMLDELLEDHTEAATNSERNVLQGKLADREGDKEAATVSYAKAVAYGYMVRYTKTEIARLSDEL